jgi:nitroimidazol reductase NimA-like FMN-containing flavoprotein (pyridoxamine 5'-phosphate oxidase superfamily)
MTLPEFTKREMENFLRKRLIAKLSTKGRDGFPHVVPIWFLYDKGEILMCTNGQTVKIKNIKEDKNVCILIDTAKDGLKIRGILIKGPAEILEDLDARKTNQRIHLKYMGRKGLADSKVSDYLSGDDVTITVKPERMCSWDYTKSPLSKTKGLALQF